MAWLLAHAPGEIGTYFGLTGQTMNGPDAIYSGFADTVVPSSKWPELREALTKVRAGATAAEIKALIAGFATGEVIAHINYMLAEDRLSKHVTADGVMQFKAM